MKNLLLLATVACAYFLGLSEKAVAAPFALPPYYAVVNDGKWPYYGDMNPTPEAAAIVSIARVNATVVGQGCENYGILDIVVPSANDGWHFYDGLWTIKWKYKQWYPNPARCVPDYYPPQFYPSGIQRTVVCDARLNYYGHPLSYSYSVHNFPNSQCPDTTPRPEKKCCKDETPNPVNIAFGFKLLREVDVSPQYAGGVAFKRNYSSLGFPTEFIVKLRGLGNHWRHTYERGIITVYDYGNAAYVLRGDGNIAYFSSTVNGYVSEADNADKLTQLTSGATVTGWTYYDASTEDTEGYDALGRLTSITSRKGVVQTLSYDGNGLLTQVIDSFGKTLTFTYDGAKRINTMTDSGNGVYIFTYASNGALETVTDPASKTTTYLYEDTVIRRGLTGIIDGNNWRHSRYIYDATGKVTETKFYSYAGIEVNKRTLSYTAPYGGGQTTVTEPSGSSRTYTFQNVIGVHKPTNITQTGAPAEVRSFDANGNTSSSKDKNGNVTCYGYDTARNLETVRVEGLPSNAVCSTALNGTLTAPARRITQTWHPTFRLPDTTIEPTSTGAKTTAFTYDTAGNTLTKSVVAAGVTRTWSWTYDGFGRVLTATNPRSHTTTNTYYPNQPAQGNSRAMLHTVTNAAGHVTTIGSYNAHAQPLTMTDANGLVTSMTYDAKQRLTNRNTGGELTVYDYDGIGQLTKVTMPDSSYLDYLYDGAHRLVQIQDGLGNRVVYTLDNSGNRVKEDYIDPANALARTRSRAFNVLNQLQQDIGGHNPSTQITQYGYDANGNQNTTTDPLGRVNTQTYDALNRLLNAIDPVNGVTAPTKYEYDEQDNLAKVTDPKNLATVYNYNGFNELLNQSSPDTGFTSFTYDAAGNLQTKTDSRSVTATYVNDALNRVTSISYPAYGIDPAELVTYTYDTCSNGKGRLCSLSDKTGTTTYSYNLLGRVTGKSQTVAGLTQSIGYGYNSAGQLNSVTYPSGAAIGYGYTNNRVSSVTINGIPVLTNADYEPFGPIGEWRWGNSTAQAVNRHTRYFDLDGRNTEIESVAGLEPTRIVYDAASRITDLQKLTANAVDPAKSLTFGYDNLDRLTSASPNSGNPTPYRGFSYDGVGNRLSATIANSVTSYGYGASSHRLNNLTGAASVSYGYDAAGNRTGTGTTAWTYGANNRPVQVAVSGTTTALLINALGQRVKKTTAGTGTRFVYDEAGRLVGEYSDSGTRITETVWFNDLPVAVMK